MKNFLSILGAVAAAVTVFAAVAVIVKKVKFKFVISSADAEPCDYDCDNCENDDCAYGDCDGDESDDDLFADIDDDFDDESEVEVEIYEENGDDESAESVTDEQIGNIVKATEKSVAEEVEKELGDN